MNLFSRCLVAFAPPALAAIESTDSHARRSDAFCQLLRTASIGCVLALAVAVGCSRSSSPEPESDDKLLRPGGNVATEEVASSTVADSAADKEQLAVSEPVPPASAASRVSAHEVSPTEAPPQKGPPRRPLPTMEPAPVDGPELRAEAAAFFEKLVQRIPDNPDALEVKARFHLLIGESQEAKECWEETLRLAPDYAYAYHGLGKVAMLNAEYEQAVEHFQKAIGGQSGNVDLAHDLADAYTKLARVDEAIQLLQKTSEQHPESTATWVQLGHAYLANRDFEKAREAFEHALRLTPDLPRAQQGLGTALMRLGEREKAKALLEAQRANRVAGKNRSAEETFEDELAEVSKRYVFAARVYLANGHSEEAEFALRRATVFQPREESAWALLLSYYQKQNRLSDAIAAAEEMCRIAPRNASYQFTLGILLGQAKDVAQARRAFQEVIRLAPQSVEGYQALARLLLSARQDWDHCIELARKGVELRGAASDFELLAQAYAVNERYDDAHRALSRAIELDPDNQAYLQAMRQLQLVMRPENE